MKFKQPRPKIGGEYHVGYPCDCIVKVIAPNNFYFKNMNHCWDCQIVKINKDYENYYKEGGPELFPIFLGEFKDLKNLNI